jgi:hypothetical protein
LLGVLALVCAAAIAAVQAGGDVDLSGLLDFPPSSRRRRR